MCLSVFVFLSASVCLFPRSVFNGLSVSVTLLSVCFMQLASVAAGLLLAALGLMPLRPPPARLADWVRLAPVVGCTAGTMFLGNAPYMYLRSV